VVEDPVVGELHLAQTMAVLFNEDLEDIVLIHQRVQVYFQNGAVEFGVQTLAVHEDAASFAQIR